MSSDLELRIAQAIARSSSLALSVTSSLSTGRFDGEEAADNSSVDAPFEINNAESVSQLDDVNSVDERKNSNLVDAISENVNTFGDNYNDYKAILDGSNNIDNSALPIENNVIDNSVRLIASNIIPQIVLPNPPSKRFLKATASYETSVNARRASQLENKALNSEEKAARQREQAWCSIIPSASGPTDEAPPLLATRSRRISERSAPPPSSLLQKPVQRNAPTTSPTISLQSRLLAPKTELAPPPPLPPAKYIPGVGHSRDWISVADLSIQTRIPKENKVSMTSRPRARSASVSGRSRSSSNSSGGAGDIAERLFYWAYETQKKRDERMNQAPDGCTFRPSLSRNAVSKKLSELPVPYLPESLIVGSSSTGSQNQNSYNDPSLSGRSSQSAAVVLPQKLIARHELLYASAVAREGRRRAREWAAYEGNPNFSFHPQIDQNTRALVSSRFNLGSTAIARGTIDSVPSSEILTMNPSAENSVVGDEVEVGHRQVSERLYLEAEEIEARRRIAADQELRRVASFHPKLNARSLAMVSGSQRPRSRSLSVSSDGPRSGGFFRKPLTYVDPETTAEALALRKMRDELAQCTFAPLLVSQATKVRGRSSSSTSSSIKKPLANGGESSEPAFERLTRLGELSQERLEQKRLEKVEKELDGTTFSPRINKNAESLMKQRLSNNERGELSSVEARLISEQRILEERLNHRRAELAMLELASCSFSPAILPASKRIAEAASKNGSARRSIGKSMVKIDDGMYATPKLTPSILRSPDHRTLSSSSALPAVSLTFSSSTAPRPVNNEDQSDIETDTTRESSLQPPSNVSRAVWERLIDTAREFEHIRARVLQTVTRRALSVLPLSLPAGSVKREVEKGCQELQRILIASRPHVPKSPETSPRAQSATRSRENGLVAKESLPTGLRASRLILWDRLTDAMQSSAEQKCLRDDLTRLIESRTASFLVRTIRPGSFSLSVVEAVAVENHRLFVPELKSPMTYSSSFSSSSLSPSLSLSQSTATAKAVSAAESAGAAWATFALDAKKLDQVLNETSNRVASAITSTNDFSRKAQYISSEGEVVELYRGDTDERQQAGEKQQLSSNHRPIDTPETSNWSTMTRVTTASSGDEGFETARSSSQLYSPKVKQALGVN